MIENVIFKPSKVTVKNPNFATLTTTPKRFMGITFRKSKTISCKKVNGWWNMEYDGILLMLSIKGHLYIESLVLKQDFDNV